MRMRALDFARLALLAAIATLVILLIAHPSLVATVFVAAIGVLVFFLVRWHARVTEYHCPECDHEFRVSAWTDFISPHTGEKKWMTCPSCGKDSWCRIL